jgi:hypothetical protein
MKFTLPATLCAVSVLLFPAAARSAEPAPAAADEKLQDISRNNMEKQYKLKEEEIVQLVSGYGGCIASDKVTVEGLPMMYMYHDKPHNEMDSGWRFLSGTETDAYMAQSEHHAVYDVNTIANYDPTIVPFLDAPVGSAFEKEDISSQFKPVK